MQTAQFNILADGGWWCPAPAPRPDSPCHRSPLTTLHRLRCSLRFPTGLHRSLTRQETTCTLFFWASHKRDGTRQAWEEGSQGRPGCCRCTIPTVTHGGSPQLSNFCSEITTTGLQDSTATLHKRNFVILGIDIKFLASDSMHSLVHPRARRSLGWSGRGGSDPTSAYLNPMYLP